MRAQGSTRHGVAVVAAATLGLAGCFGSGSGSGTSPTQGERPAAAVPDKDSFSIARERASLDDAFDEIGVKNEITVRVSDNLNNTAIPDGTRVHFTSSRGGSIEPFCETADSACSVTWRRTGERPDAGPADTTGNARDPGCGQVRQLMTRSGIQAATGDGCRRPNRVTVMAWVEGQESFTDTNANGLFDDGDVFNAADDIPEAFRDDNENGARDDDEVFADYPCGISTSCGDSASYDTADGLYSGPDCAHSTLCDDQQRLFVFGNTVFALPSETIDLTITNCAGSVLATTNPNGSTSTINVSGSRGICFIAYDSFGNPVPDGTTVSYDAGDALGDFTGDSTYGESSQVRVGTATLEADSTSNSGTATLTLEEPNGDVTDFSFPVSD